MIRAYIMLVVAFLIAIQLDVTNEPLVLGHLGLAAALILVILTAIIDLYGELRDL